MLKLRKHLKNIILTRSGSMTGMAGNITFDANKVKKEDYEFYSSIGFMDLFEEDLEEESNKVKSKIVLKKQRNN